jgi:hypothetical protein
MRRQTLMAPGPDRLEYGSVEVEILAESPAADPQFRERFDRDLIRVAHWGFDPPHPQ